ncbi:MAG: hypothetical protein R8K20_05800 [Gallionellaceae bacterium]
MQQLDIFADSVSVQLSNDLIAALLNFDHVVASQTLQHLTKDYPQHAGLAQYPMLCDFIKAWADNLNNPEWLAAPAAIATEEQWLREKIIPAAKVMGSAGNKLAHKCWGILAQASERVGIDPKQNDYFAAELYLRAQQFADVVRIAQKVPGAEMRAMVQRWLGLGYYGCGESEPARSATLRYAWLAPQQFDAFVEATGDTQLARDWSDFQSELGELDATWFPAWCANEKKAGIGIREHLPNSDGGEAYRLLISLSIRERGGLCSAVYEERTRLKQLNENFFAYYMRRRTDRDARIP